MKRESFERESGILKQDFNKLIGREGGKAAGLRLLETGLDNMVRRGLLVNSQDARIGWSNWHLIDMEFYRAVEKVLKRCHLTDEQAWRSVRSGELLRNYEISGAINREIRNCKAEFPGQARISEKAFSADASVHFHLRGSETVVDWRDDRYYGTFFTKEDVGFFHPLSDGNCWGTGNLARLLATFYAMKYHSKGRYELKEEDGVAGVLQPTVRGNKSKNNVIVYSGYPERKSDVVMEVWHSGGMVRYPEQFMRFDGEHVEITPARIPGLLPEVKYEHKIDGQDSTISKPVSDFIASMARGFQDMLAYPVNLEIVVTDNKYVVPVQLRPVPTLSEKREKIELGSLPENAYLIGETPFVIGTFRKTARLAMAHFKNDTDHRFRKPVILWHSDYKKGCRLYDEDKNCIALLNPEEGAALTHSSSILPDFGDARERFAFIGLPIPGLKEKLDACMKLVKEKVGRSSGGTGSGYFSYTPFEITIESDGRRGRAYVDQRYAGLLK